MNEVVRTATGKTLTLYYDVEQGTKEWLLMRMGKITASSIHPLFVNSGGYEYSKGGVSYIRKKVEELLFQNIQGWKADSCDWGIMHESTARSLYADKFGTTIDLVGFVSSDDGTACSPDGLVGQNGLVEIKCPYKEEVHQSYLDKQEAPKEYLFQMLHQLIVTERIWVDFVSYDPRNLIKLFVKRYTVNSILLLLNITKELYSRRIEQTKWMIDVVYEICKTMLEKEKDRAATLQFKEATEHQEEIIQQSETWD